MGCVLGATSRQPRHGQARRSRPHRDDPHRHRDHRPRGHHRAAQQLHFRRPDRRALPQWPDVPDRRRCSPHDAPRWHRHEHSNRGRIRIGWKLAWVLRGRAPPGLLDTYEDERRPIGLHNVGRAAEAGGARRITDEALPWDLDDRLAHCWLHRDGEKGSTLDLIGDGLTLFVATDDTRWAHVAEQTGFTAPVEIVITEPQAAAALGLAPTGAVLVRPDGHEVAGWSTTEIKTLPEPGVAWLAGGRSGQP